MIVKAPEDVKELIKNKFALKMGKAVKRDGTIPGFTIINKRNYSMSYVKDVLEGKDPDLSVLFDTKDGQLFRNQDPVWAMFKGTKVSEKGAKICGVLITQEGIKEILERPVFNKIKPKHIELKQSTLALDPLVVSEYERWCIKDRFCIKNGEVVYRRDSEPFGDYTSINYMRYSKGYVRQVLENKNPDISDLFELSEGVICRSQDPIWGRFKSKPVTYAKVCGVIFTGEGYVQSEQSEHPGNPD